ncbi:hypothetical protein DUPY_29690 [Duganella phyllosphaerae]|uniref:Uncharacterized protein n=2 Tax=Duganella phyllosphaerae TaxID=762836 RepID=A0A1E7WJK7_9BURK|nr:hypothetical protein DUPY_29690 [Duganella phyllosphaerae]
MEVAVLHAAVAAHADRLSTLLADAGLPELSVSNMRIELSATQQALRKLSASRFEAVNALDAKNVSAAESQYREFCRLRDYRKPGVEVCQHTEAEAFTLATGQRIERQSISAVPTYMEAEKSR